MAEKTSPNPANEMSDEDLRRREIEDSMGVDPADLDRDPLKQRLARFLYSPRTEIGVLFLIIASVGLLVLEVILPNTGPVGWMGGVAARQIGGVTFYVDVAISLVFLAEYLMKLWVAPRKWYFVRKNVIDLLAILPVLRVLRLGRVLRLLRLLRLLRMMRVAPIMAQRLENMSAELHKRTAENLVIFVYLVFSLLFGTIGILVFEKGQSSGFETLGDGLWWCIVTLTTVGYGDKFPVSLGGKAVATVVMFIGLSFYALLTGVLSSMLIDRSRREEGKGMDVMTIEDHVVVCGWNDHAERLLEDLRSADRMTQAIVLSDREDIPRLMDPRIHYVAADATTEKGLRRAKVESSRVVVVLSDTAPGRSSSDADARSVLTALAVERMNPEIHTIVEIVHEENLFHLRNAGVDEVIISGAYTGTMLSQAAQFPGISDVFADLFQSGGGSQLREVPVKASDKTFGALVERLLNTNGVVAIGYRRGEGVNMVPAPDTSLSLGDRAIVMSRIDQKT